MAIAAASGFGDGQWGWAEGHLEEALHAGEGGDLLRVVVQPLCAPRRHQGQAERAGSVVQS